MLSYATSLLSPVSAANQPSTVSEISSFALCTKRYAPKVSASLGTALSLDGCVHVWCDAPGTHSVDSGGVVEEWGEEEEEEEAEEEDEEEEEEEEEEVAEEEEEEEEDGKSGKTRIAASISVAL